MKKTDRTVAVWMTGSRVKIRRVLYTDGSKYFVKWYGNLVEVKQIDDKWISVEAY